MIVWIILLLSVQATLTTGDPEQKYRALSFGRTKNDKVKFWSSDMRPFASSFTVCSWMKRLHDAVKPIVFHYALNYSDAIIIGDNGFWNYINNNLNLTGKFPEAGEWFLYCLSWAAGGTQRVYVNGIEVGSQSAASINFRLKGNIVLGNLAYGPGSPTHTFGGQLYKLNLYSKQLTSSEVKEMADAGMCSNVEEKYETRQLKWEDLILTGQRSGNVTEFLPECDKESIIDSLRAKLNETETELRNVNRQLLDTEKELTETRTELDEARKLETVSRWNVLYTPPYLNKLLTRQLYNQLTNSWNMMENFIGENVTEALVEHFREHHEQYEDDETCEHE